MELRVGVISPQDWKLSSPVDLSEEVHERLGASFIALRARADAATAWLCRQFDLQAGRFRGDYVVGETSHMVVSVANLLVPWQLMAAYDRTHDADLFDIAVRAVSWFYQNCVETHRRSLFAGGVYEQNVISTRRTAESVTTFLGLWARTDSEQWLARALQGGRYLIQARRHDFATGYAPPSHRWLAWGADGWGEVTEALLLLANACEDDLWFNEALYWGERAVGLQSENGAFYPLNGEYYNSGLVAAAIRALVMLHQVTARHDFAWVATNYAGWHRRHQLDEGGWPLTVDGDGNIVMPAVSAGDVADIAIALLHLHYITQDTKYLDMAYRAMRYILTRQAMPGSEHTHVDGPGVRGGFWAWDPYHNYTLSTFATAQSTRALWWILDYWHTYLSGERNT